MIIKKNAINWFDRNIGTKNEHRSYIQEKKLNVLV